MTRVDKSPEQLDAEAAARKLGPRSENKSTEPSFPPLADRIRQHRRLARAEVWIPRLHARDGDDAGVGVPFNEQFARYLEERYGTVYPWSNGLRTVRVDCRRTHAEHWGDPFDGSLCYTLVSMVCRWDWDFARACFELGLHPSRTEPVMQRALRRIEERLAELQARATSTVESDKGRHDWQAPAHVHRPLDGLHAEDCPQCRRSNAA